MPSDSGVDQPTKQANGEACATRDDCLSDHCGGELCCADGACCRESSDCPKRSDADLQLACDDSRTCQGSAGVATCRDFRCVVDDGVPDDSACSEQQQAKDCAPYRPVFCNGRPEQTEPSCPTTCERESDCVSGAHCTSEGVCESGVAADGSSCSYDADCKNDHCQNGLCCASGDCCRKAETCRGYGAAGECTEPSKCQGSRNEVTCNTFQCQSAGVSDSSTCVGKIASDCGNYLDVVCSDSERQAVCAIECKSDSQCKPGAVCDTISGEPYQCRNKVADGEYCFSSLQCANTCNHGVCCTPDNPDAYCCHEDADCKALTSSGCVTTTSCEGQSTSASCDQASHTCSVKVASDATVCTQTIKCGAAYLSKAARCPVECGCTSNSECNTGYSCNALKGSLRGTCEADLVIK